MKITGLLTDDAVLAELGARIAGRRIELQLTQAAVAEQAGIAKRTLERMEAGLTSQLATLVRVLRVLDAASGLDSVIPESGPRPMDLLKRKSKATRVAMMVCRPSSGEKAMKTPTENASAVRSGGSSMASRRRNVARNINGCRGIRAGCQLFSDT